MKKTIVIGLMAHVDSGKTTLSEAVLFKSGTIRKLGRVDHKDAFLDTSSIERDRGITVFSKEARFSIGEKEFVLLDTPGHRDFSTEMERALSVLDYAVMVVSGTEGVQAHTMTLWNLFKAYSLPVITFVNKMDMPSSDKNVIMNDLKNNFGAGFVEFESNMPIDSEEIAVSDEHLMEKYLDTGKITREDITRVISESKIYPVIFGSALKLEGIDELISFLDTYIAGYKDENKENVEFSARVFKISRDKKGNRETRLKVLTGTIKAKDSIVTSTGRKQNDTFEAELSDPEKYIDEKEENENISEKIEQIRKYNGESFDACNIAYPGDIVSVTGLNLTYAGQGLGTLLKEDNEVVLEPPLTYRMFIPKGMDYQQALKKLEVLMEENPTLNLLWNEEMREIQVSVMGELELEILTSIIHDRFDMDVSFGQGSIVYKETLSRPVIGIGHYEPLRHYAEVQLLLKPAEPGSGLKFNSLVTEDELKKNWQRLILTHLRERKHKGTLTRSDITDMEISIVQGRAHLKHTMGGDFRQATYRGVRQGLRQAKEEGCMVLLEPMYRFSLEIPQEYIGRAMTDLQRLFSKSESPEIINVGSKQNAVIRGTGPVATLYDYQNEVNKYTGGQGRFTTILAGYMPCHNQEEIVTKRAYNPDNDKFNSCGSVFCEHGAGTYVEWDQVKSWAHTEVNISLDDQGNLKRDDLNDIGNITNNGKNTENTDKELNRIFEQTYGKSKRDEQYLKDRQSKATRLSPKESDNYPKPNRKGSGKNTHLIIDGYNLIFGWDELKEIASVNFDAAREVLIDVLQNYQGYHKTGITLVFDGYKLQGNQGSEYSQGDLKVVYTREGKTADRYIEEMVFDMGKEYDLTCVTSDLPVQMAAFGDGARRISQREFHEEVISTSSEIRDKLSKQKQALNRPFEGKL